MKIKIANAAKNLFLKNLSAYSVVVFITPLLTRLYEPHQFGTLSLMVFVSSVLGVFFTLRLELAIPLIKEPDSLNNLIKLLLYGASLFSIISTIIIYLFIDEILRIFVSEEGHGDWLLIAPLYGLTLAINGIFMLFLTKEQKFHEMGMSLLFQNCFFCLLALFFSKFSFNFNGLIVAKFLGIFASIIYLSIFVKCKLKDLNFFYVQFKSIEKNLGKLKQFVQFNLPISVMGIIGKDLMILIFAYSQGISYAGFYALARVIGELPKSFLSAALGPVFYSEISKTSDSSSLKSINLNEIKQILKVLFVLVIPAYLTISVYSEELFKLLLGAGWEMSGRIFLFLLPITTISLFSCWLIRLFEAHGKQNISFKIQLIFEGFGFIVGLILIYFNVQVEIILAAVTSFFAFVPIIITVFAFKMLGLKSFGIILTACFFMVFALFNPLIMVIFSSGLNDKIHDIWLILCSVIFLLIGQYLFRNYRIRDLNVFS